MGNYTDRLFKNKKSKPYTFKGEKLVGCAIIRSGVLHKGYLSHAELRRHIGDEHPSAGQHGDVEGFYTSSGRFVNRHEAKTVGELSGQTRPQARELLSSDIRW